MSLTSMRSRLTCALIVSAAALFVVAPAANATSASNYLALGDSLAYGYQGAKFQAQYPNINEASFNTGYVNAFAKLQLKPNLNTVNLGCPGETSNSLVKGGRSSVYTGGQYVPNPYVCGDSPSAGIGAVFNKQWLHHYYAGSQLDEAVAYLHANPTTTKTVSIDIGANDLLVFLEGCGFRTANVDGACIANGLPGAYGNTANNLNTILTKLQAEAPSAKYVVLGLYNPYPGVLNVGGLTGDSATKQFNGLLKQVATAHGAKFANPLPVFNPSSNVTGASEALDIPVICKLTAMCPGGTFNPASGDIHPTDLGYGILGGLVWAAWLQ